MFRLIWSDDSIWNREITCLMLIVMGYPSCILVQLKFLLFYVTFAFDLVSPLLWYF